MKATKSLLDLSVTDALRRYPALLSLLLKQHAGCVGCPMAAFCSLGSAVEIHNLDTTEFPFENENPDDQPYRPIATD